MGGFEYVICTEALGASKRGAVDAEDRGRIDNLICRGFRVIDLSSTDIFFGGPFFFKNRNKDGDCIDGFLRVF